MYSKQDLMKLRNEIDQLHKDGWLESNKVCDTVLECQNFIQFIIDNYDDEACSAPCGGGISLGDVLGSL